MDHSLTHQSILQQAKSGDPRGWQRLLDVYRPFLAGWTRRHTTMAQDAEDLAQEILSRVVRTLPRFEHNGRPGAFRAWLRTLAVRATSDFWSTRHPELEGTPGSDLLASLRELEDPHADLTRLWDLEHDQFVLNRLIEHLRTEFEARSITMFLRQALDDAPAETVAREMNLSVAAVYTAKSRVLRRLRELSEGLLDWDG